MSVAEPWQKAEIPGPKKALVITKPEVVVAMVKRAKRPILIVGHKVVETTLDNEKYIDLLIRLAEVGKIPMVAAAHIVGEFKKRGFDPAAWMPILDIGSRLVDPKWKGLNGEGQYDLALFTGFQYYMEWLVLSGLKSFAPSLETISLNRFYQPNASWSFPNLSEQNWSQHINTIIEKLGGK